MTITRLDLNKKNLDRFSLGAFGPYGCGKTHLQGDFLRWAAEQGKGPVAFVNISGQDGYTTISDMGLGNIGYSVDNLDDFQGLMDQLYKEKCFALAIDGLHDMLRLILVKHFGELRYPDPKKDGERGKMLWSQIKWDIYQEVLRSKKSSPYVCWVAPHDKNEDLVTGDKGTGVDLPGKAAQAATGWFDLMGYLTAQTLGPNRVERKFQVKPSAGLLVRQRLPIEITEDIVIPKDKGGFLAIYNRVRKSMGQETMEAGK